MLKLMLKLSQKKTDLKNGTGTDTSKLATKSDLVSLKVEVDKLDIDKSKCVPTNVSNLKSKVDKLHIGKLETTPVDLSKLSNVAKIDVAKKMHIMLRSKILKLKYPILLT